ncbi:MAG: hypothetical protein ACJ72M_03775 [Propionibacteriaceae bacterium]|jgi:hypothetical protein
MDAPTAAALANGGAQRLAIGEPVDEPMLSKTGSAMSAARDAA